MLLRGGHTDSYSVFRAFSLIFEKKLKSKMIFQAYTKKRKNT